MPRLPSREGAVKQEQTPLEKLLHLEGGAFVKRPKGAGLVIEPGWEIDREVRMDGNKRGVLVLREPGERGKPREDEDAITVEELVRLNTGRNRKALEYLFSLPNRDARDKLISWVDTADHNEGARESLQKFFEEAALRFARKQFDDMRARKADIEPMDAATIDELLEYIQYVEHWFLESYDRIVQGFKDALEAEQTKRRPDPEEVKECEYDLKRALGERRHAERAWTEKVRTILNLIDLSQEFLK